MSMIKQLTVFIALFVSLFAQTAEAEKTAPVRFYVANFPPYAFINLLREQQKLVCNHLNDRFPLDALLDVKQR